MNIVLIGYRGTGKTSVGKKLAEKLDRRFTGTDELIIQKAGMSIPKIVDNYGWDVFRNIESEVVKEVSKKDNWIIDTGGGVVLRRINVKNLKKKGMLILLKADIKTIINRIKHDKERPSLSGRKSFIEEVEEVLKQRSKKYEEAADYTIDTTILTIDQVTYRIIAFLTQKGFRK
ncbi:shikimate kinase [Candidatus Bathyarchaeota archaeon]|nr:shikimate kinase [Candidatus Bathyarchaeota archaeon]